MQIRKQGDMLVLHSSLVVRCGLPQ